MPVLRSALQRALPGPDRADRRLSHPGTGRPLQAAVVVDLDLANDAVHVQAALTAFAAEPEGVLAICWFHGVPVGEVLVVGAPCSVLPDLPAVARTRLRQDLVRHLLSDALIAPAGVARASASGLQALEHPAAEAVAHPTVTVAVCTRDRPEPLRECLQALDALVGPVLELVVVDNASHDDRTRDVVADFPRARYVREPRRGLDWARNTALLEARGDVVAYTDDDVLVHPGWVQALARTFAEEPAAACVTGLVVPAELSTPAQVLFEVNGGFGRGYSRRWFSAAVEQGEVPAAVFGGTGRAGTGANMALRRDVAMALGGFDPALDVGTPTGGGGDLEMFFRVVAAGHQVVYEPSALVRHRHRAELPELHRQMRGNGTGSFAVLAGAGRRYGLRQYASFLSGPGRWYLRHHAQAWVRGVVAPDVQPPWMKAAERNGAADAIRYRYYRRAERAAEEQHRAHPGSRLALVRPAAPARRQRAADPVITVDLLTPHGAHLPTTTSRRTRVRVLRGGRLQDVFTVANRGAPLSPNRLRSALVDRLGGAVLHQGLSWYGEDHEVVGTGGNGPGAAGGAHRPTADQDRCLDGLLREGGGGDPGAPTVAGSVSVLLATRDRPEMLARSLEALAEQRTSRQIQVVVVDNSLDPLATERVVRRHEGAVCLHEPRPGLSRARNTGFAAVTGDLVVFVDDDVVVPEGWLESLLAPLADPRVGAVTGNVLPANVEALAPQVFEDYGGLSRGPHCRLFLPEWLDTGTRAVPTWTIGATASAAVRASAMRELGPWDEVLGAGTPAGVGEDTEYFYRLLRAGWWIAYEATAVVEHTHRPDLMALRRQLHAYSAGHVAYHLQLLTEHGDFRGLRRLALLPRHFSRQGRAVLWGRDDYPLSLLSAEVGGYLMGPAAWVRARRHQRRSA